MNVQKVGTEGSDFTMEESREKWNVYRTIIDLRPIELGRKIL